MPFTKTLIFDYVVGGNAAFGDGMHVFFYNAAMIGIGLIFVKRVRVGHDYGQHDVARTGRM